MLAVKFIYQVIFCSILFSFHITFGQESNNEIALLTDNNYETLSNNSAVPSSDASEQVIRNGLNALETIKNIGQSAMTGAKNLVNAVPEDFKNEVSNITEGITSDDIKKAVESIHSIVTNVLTQKGNMDYQTIASEWISKNPKLSAKITSFIQMIINRTKSLPQTDQQFIFNWTQSHQDIIQKISNGELNEGQLTEAYKESLEELIAIPETDRKAFDLVIPGLGTLLVDPTLIDKINTAIANTTKENLKDINKYIFSKIINLSVMPSTTTAIK